MYLKLYNFQVLTTRNIPQLILCFIQCKKLSITDIRNCWTKMLARSLDHIIILVHFDPKYNFI
jgi:hypothetical protein